MIAWLNGIIREKHPGYIVLRIGDVGYLINISLSTFYSLPEKGDTTELHIHTYVKEDAISLFGFATNLELKLFNLLIGVNKIGPKLAITILSGLKSEELIDAVNKRNVLKLSSAPGVGKKTAERIIMELSDKLSGLSATTSEVGGEISVVPVSMPDSDAVDALMALGYKKQEAQRAVNSYSLQNANSSLEDIIKGALLVISG